MTEKKTVLVVEDDEGYRLLITDALTDAGLKVISARNGAEALEKIELMPDVLVADFTLPDSNGVSIIKAVRRKAGWGETVPIFMLTQREDMKTVTEAVEQHISGYFVKSNHDLSAIVHQVKQSLGLS